MRGSMKLVAGLFSIVEHIAIIYVAIDERLKQRNLESILYSIKHTDIMHK